MRCHQGHRGIEKFEFGGKVLLWSLEIRIFGSMGKGRDTFAPGSREPCGLGLYLTASVPLPSISINFECLNLFGLLQDLGLELESRLSNPKRADFFLFLFLFQIIFIYLTTDLTIISNEILS
jgi:hypothetical protein